jgi:RNA polymerase sigma-54 factor
MSMQLGLFQTARMEQRLVQSPQMIQAMQILQLSSLDLQERIEQELLENPHTLERRPRSLSEQDGSTS